MREAIIQALRATNAVTDVTGNRIYGRQGLLGGISRDKTPEAFDESGRLMTSLTVNLESRVSREGRDGIGVISATQTFQVWAVSDYGYGEIKQALTAVRQVLHRHAKRGVHLTPVEETTVRWTDTNWASTSPELYDEPLRAPTMFMRFDATITEPI